LLKTNCYLVGRLLFFILPHSGGIFELELVSLTKKFGGALCFSLLENRRRGKTVSVKTTKGQTPPFESHWGPANSGTGGAFLVDHRGGAPPVLLKGEVRGCSR